MNPSATEFDIALKVIDFLFDNQKKQYQQAEMYKDPDKMAKATKLIERIYWVKMLVIDNRPIN